MKKWQEGDWHPLATFFAIREFEVLTVLHFCDSTEPRFRLDLELIRILIRVVYQGFGGAFYCVMLLFISLNYRRDY